MRVLIAGGTGYIGGRIAAHLSRAGYTVIVGVRKSALSPKWLLDCDIVQMDWNDPADLYRTCLDVDVVVHAAGMNAKDCLADPVAALHFNGVATARFAAAASKAGVEKFIYLSTIHVYASPISGIINEDTCPSNPHLPMLRLTTQEREHYFHKPSNQN